jgi:hypothetical protein
MLIDDTSHSNPNPSQRPWPILAEPRAPPNPPLPNSLALSNNTRESDIKSLISTSSSNRA